MKNTNKDLLYIVGAFVIMGILFYSSSMPYSDQSVTPFLDRFLQSEPLKGLLSNIEFMYAGSEVSIAALGYSRFVEFFIRKGAHFFIYFLLSFFWFMGLKSNMKSVPLAALVAFMLAAGYASFDEFHQGLTPERTPLLEDIMLDSAGAIVGVVTTWLFSANFKKRKRRNRYRF